MIDRRSASRKRVVQHPRAGAVAIRHLRSQLLSPPAPNMRGQSCLGCLDQANDYTITATIPPRIIAKPPQISQLRYHDGLCVK